MGLKEIGIAILGRSNSNKQNDAHVADYLVNEQRKKEVKALLNVKDGEITHEHLSDAGSIIRNKDWGVRERASMLIKFGFQLLSVHSPFYKENPSGYGEDARITRMMIADPVGMAPISRAESYLLELYNIAVRSDSAQAFRDYAKVVTDRAVARGDV